MAGAAVTHARVGGLAVEQRTRASWPTFRGVSSVKMETAKRGPIRQTVSLMELRLTVNREAPISVEVLFDTVQRLESREKRSSNGPLRLLACEKPIVRQPVISRAHALPEKGAVCAETTIRRLRRTAHCMHLHSHFVWLRLP